MNKPAPLVEALRCCATKDCEGCELFSPLDKEMSCAKELKLQAAATISAQRAKLRDFKTTLPCMPGDKLYAIYLKEGKRKPSIIEITVESLVVRSEGTTIKGYCDGEEFQFLNCTFGETVFFTRQAAECKMTKKGKEENEKQL